MLLAGCLFVHQKNRSPPAFHNAASAHGPDHGNGRQQVCCSGMGKTDERDAGGTCAPSWRFHVRLAAPSGCEFFGSCVCVCSQPRNVAKGGGVPVTLCSRAPCGARRAARPQGHVFHAWRCPHFRLRVQPRRACGTATPRARRQGAAGHWAARRAPQIRG